MLRAKAAGNHGRPIFLANCDTELGYVPYVGRYVGIRSDQSVTICVKGYVCTFLLLREKDIDTKRVRYKINPYCDT